MKENFENMEKLKCTQLNFGAERIIIIDNGLLYSIYMEEINSSFMYFMLGLEKKVITFYEVLEIIRKNIKDWRITYYEALEKLEEV